MNTDKWDGYWRTYKRTDSIRRSQHRCAEIVIGLIESGIAPRTIIDLGGGTGEIGTIIHRATGATVVNMDLSQEALKRSGGLRVRVDAETLPLESDSVECVVSFGHASVGSYPNVVGEIQRVLAPNGIAIIDFINISVFDFLLHPSMVLRWGLRYLGYGNKVCYHYGPLGIREHFATHGLVELRRWYPSRGVIVVMFKKVLRPSSPENSSSIVI